MKDVRRLEVYNLAMVFAERVGLVLKKFPKGKGFRLIDQLEGSSVSVFSNIREDIYLTLNQSF